MASYRGVGRRFEIVGEVADVTVIDDYAHHPTEVRATLAAARSRYPGRRIVAVFQPHTYSRSALYAREFAAALSEADLAVVTDIYAAREPDTGIVHARDIAGAVAGGRGVYGGDLDATIALLMERIQPGDVVLTLGAGDITTVGPAVLHLLAGRGGGTMSGVVTLTERAKITAHEPLRRHTTLHVGGPADWFLKIGAADGDEPLQRALQWAAAEGIPVTVIGGGSNILAADAGVDGLVIKLLTPRLAPAIDRSDPSAPLVTGHAGMPMSGFAEACGEAGLAGLEWAVGLAGDARRRGREQRGRARRRDERIVLRRHADPAGRHTAYCARWMRWRIATGTARSRMARCAAS